MSNYRGFDINTNTTPAPWGAREQQMVQDNLDTLCGDTILGTKDTTGHKHGNVYDPSGNALVSAGSVGVVLLTDSTGAGAIELLAGQAVEIIYGTSLISVSPTDIEIRAEQDIVLDNFNSLQYLYTGADGHLHQGPFGPDATRNHVLIPANVKMQLTKAASYIEGNTIGDIEIETTDNSITIQNSGTSSGTINITNNYFDINVHALSTGKISIQGSDITLTAGSHVIIPTIPSSSAGLTTGMLWVTSGGALMRMA